MEEEKQQVQVDCKQAEENQHGQGRKIIVFLLPIDAHGHVNAMIGIADQLRSLGKFRTIFLCNDSQSPRHFGHELVPLRKVQRNQSVEELMRQQVDLVSAGDEERAFLGDEKLNSKWAAMVELLDFRIHKPEFCVQALAHNYRLLKLTLEAEVVPLDASIERCLIELKPALVVVDQLCPIPAVWRLSNCQYALKCGLSKPLTWMTVASCNPMPLYHASHLGFPPPLMGLSARGLRGVELEIEQLRHERALRDSDLPETLLRLYSLAATENSPPGWSFEQFARNESPCAPNVYMFPRALDYALDGRGIRLPADRWIRVDSLVRGGGGSRSNSTTTTTTRDEQLLEQVAKWRRAHKQQIIIIYLSMGTTMSSNLGLMNSLVGQVCNCLELEPRWNFALALGPRGSQLAPSVRGQLQQWQARGRLLSSAWWPQPELFRRKLVDVCVSHGGNNTLCEVFAASQPPVNLILVAGFHDQLDNARRVADLGWGVALTASQLLEQQPTREAATSGGDLLRSAILGSIGLKRPAGGESQDDDCDGEEEAGLRNSQFCAQLMGRVAGGSWGKTVVKM